MLLMEFWTAKGFQEHQSSYNRLVLRRNGYGSAKAILGGLVSGERAWTEAPIELVGLIQIRPDHARYELEFTLGLGWYESIAGSFQRWTGEWVDEYIAFVNEWTLHAQRALGE
jgi:hypothetical protein